MRPDALFTAEQQQRLGDLMARWELPGGQVALAKDGRLVLNRGYGLADVDAGEPVQPTSLFRIASVSKPITAVAVLQLAAKGRLRLDDRVMDHMRLTPLLAPGARPDPRWGRVTVRHCLQHTGGWDRNRSYDPIGRP